MPTKREQRAQQAEEKRKERRRFRAELARDTLSVISEDGVPPKEVKAAFRAIADLLTDDTETSLQNLRGLVQEANDERPTEEQQGLGFDVIVLGGGGGPDALFQFLGLATSRERHLDEMKQNAETLTVEDLQRWHDKEGWPGPCANDHCNSPLCNAGRRLGFRPNVIDAETPSRRVLGG